MARNAGDRKRGRRESARALAAGVAALGVSLGVSVDDVLAATVAPPPQQVDGAPVKPAFENSKDRTTTPTTPLEFEGVKGQVIDPSLPNNLSKERAPPSLPVDQSKHPVIVRDPKAGETDVRQPVGDTSAKRPAG